MTEVFLGILDTSSPPPLLASDDTYTATENSTLNVSAALGILANDQDSEELSAILVEPPTHGTVTLNDDGSFVYRPDPDFNREDSFQYVASDGTADSNVATVTITVKTDYPWHNGVEPLNVSDDKYFDGFKEVDNITPFDALLVINELNTNGNYTFALDRPRPLARPFYDVNCDGQLTPLDALLVINFLNSGEGEGESVLAAQNSIMLAAPLEPVSTSLRSGREVVSHLAGVMEEPVLLQALLTGMPTTKSLRDAQLWGDDDTEWTWEDLEAILGELVTGQVDL